MRGGEGGGGGGGGGQKKNEKGGGGGGGGGGVLSGLRFNCLTDLHALNIVKLQSEVEFLVRRKAATQPG